MMVWNGGGGGNRSWSQSSFAPYTPLTLNIYPAMNLFTLAIQPYEYKSHYWITNQFYQQEAAKLRVQIGNLQNSNRYFEGKLFDNISIN